MIIPFATLFIFLVSIAITVPVAILNGLVLTILWGWFVVPFFGLPPMPIPEAIGIAIIASYLTKDINCAKAKEKSITETALTTIGYPAMNLLMGYIVHLFL